MKLIIIAVFLFAASHSVLGKTWEFCELTRLLRNKHHFKDAELPDWMCLIKHESRYNQAATNKANSDGSWDWGLFQLNDNYWCHGHFNGKSNGCGVDCRILAYQDPDLSKNVACVRTVFRAHGLDGWMGWKAHCKGKNLSNYKTQIHNCLKRSDEAELTIEFLENLEDFSEFAEINQEVY